jgi:fermentation-respiration switch protein FrsA (DUF1100 family)
MFAEGIQDIIRSPEDGESEHLELVTSNGILTCRHHPSDGDRAILWVFGAGGGLGGPAGGLYTRLGHELRLSGIASLELAYRKPGRLQECVLDVLTGIGCLGSFDKKAVVLVGHSFGGAVVINAGILSDAVIAVAALSSQMAGAGQVARLSPKPVLFVHGEDDEILPAACSRELYARADEPKSIILYSGCGHGLDQCRDALDRDLTAWLGSVLPGRSDPG